MTTLISEGLAYLLAQSLMSLLLLFWVVVVFEVPRYAMLFLTAMVTGVSPRAARRSQDVAGEISMVVAGHNEADAVETCIRALHEQSRPPEEIIVVSDGSTDDTPARIRGLQRRGLVDQVHCTRLRAGKSAGLNLACRHAGGDILVNVDLDCTFDRHAIKNIVAPFADPAVGAVCGNLMVRDQTATMITAFQAIEYLISISLGKRAAMLTDQVVCVSGAFGAFRRDALEAIGGLDVGGGEDLDCTIRLRKAGWKVVFAADAIAYTKVPATPAALVRQRFRWERDALRLRYRKHGEQMNPFSPRFLFTEFLHEAEFILFHITAAVAMPFYVLWLVLAYGDLAPMILFAAQSGLLVLDAAAFAMAAIVTPRAGTLELLPYLPGCSLFTGFFLRFMRLAAYLQEWLFDASSRDTYVPFKVNLVKKW